MNNLNFTGYLIYKNRELVADSPPLPRQVGGTKIVRFWSTVGSDKLTTSCGPRTAKLTTHFWLGYLKHKARTGCGCSSSLKGN